VSRERRLGWLLVTVGGALAFATQVAAPVGVPLLDGVIVVEPYRYLHPAASQDGDPTSYESTESVKNGQSPVFAAATEEGPPQAQLVAQADAFTVPAGVTKLKVSITPVDPVAQPGGGAVAGNVYRFSVTDEAGNPLAAKPCDTCRSLVLRAPDGVADASVGRFADGVWTKVATLHAGTVAMYQANADALGDFAIIAGGGAAPGGAAPGAAGIDPLLFGGVALAAFFAVVVALFWYRRRPPPVPVARLGPGRGRVPSKRRGPRRPPSGRSRS
jgi:hypothetical protein